MQTTHVGSTMDGPEDGQTHDASELRPRLCLVLAWSRREPARIGETLVLGPGAPGAPDGARSSDGAVVIGRSGLALADHEQAAHFVRQRPGDNVDCGPLMDPTVSRRQMLVYRESEGFIRVENVGRGRLYLNGEEVTAAVVQQGDVLSLDQRLVLLAAVRPGRFPDAPTLSAGPVASERQTRHGFGQTDASGFVGESAAAWAVREQVAFLAERPYHVLIMGQSGVGKELVARAIHDQSERGGKSLVTRNAATIPAGLADAEFFGNVKNYPNPGMAARPGLIGKADGSTLFLDELGELPVQLQAHLLRVLDDDGEYQRLGDATPRRADVRVIAATNRSLDELRHDIVPRFTLRVMVPGLNDRRDDIPFLIHHLLRRAMQENPSLAARFNVSGPDGMAAVDPELVRVLLTHHYNHHVRELQGLLWRAISTSYGSRIELTAGLRAEMGIDRSIEPIPKELTPETIQASMERNRGVQERVWRELGLKNRFQLRRLIKKHGIKTDFS